MNGEIKTVGFNDKITWDFFKTLPVDLQEEYLDHQVKRFGVGMSRISVDLFGLTPQALGNHIARHGLNVMGPGKRKMPKAAWESWNRWINSGATNAPVSEPADVTCVPKSEGEWLPDEYRYDMVRCSSCGATVDEDDASDTCPVCKAHMTSGFQTPTTEHTTEPEVKPFRAHDFDELFRACGLEQKTENIEPEDEGILYPLTGMNLELKGTPVDILATLRMSFPALLDKDKSYRFSIKVDGYVL